ncbi:MAG: hypothetical protein ABSF26_25520 [Thermoguttaceae bacterium]|jgi:hypothetical protein
MKPQSIQQRTINSIATLFDRDEMLFRINASERAITHWLAYYMVRRFSGWDVDCEYNRDGHDHKKLVKDLEPLRESEEDSVYPDIIVHHRTKRFQPHNLLVIEVKKTTNTTSRDIDLTKLRIFTTDYHRRSMNYHYQLGLFLEVGAWPTKPSHGVLMATGIWFGEGQQLDADQQVLCTKSFDYRREER